jgi:hypothetical protein
MQVKHSGSLALCLFVLLVSFAIPALARFGRDFAGTYKVEKVIENGKVVHLTLTIKVFNNGEDAQRRGCSL